VTLLDRTQGLTLHHQIAMLLEDQLRSGVFRPGDQLPGEEELRQSYEVSRVTIRRALQSLETRGLVSRERGRGTYVRDMPPAPSLPMPLKAFTQAMAERRARSKPHVEEFGFVSAKPEVAEALALAAGDPVLRVVRVRVAAGLPIFLSELFLAEPVGRLLRRAELNRLSLTEALQARGIRYGRIEMVFGACLASATLARTLQVGAGSALVDVLRIGRDTEGRPFEYQSMRGPPDRFQVPISIGEEQAGDS
jgi:GntR family transcriptional regulator